MPMTPMTANPESPNRLIPASVPPANMTSAVPRLMTWIASPKAWFEAAQPAASQRTAPTHAIAARPPPDDCLVERAERDGRSAASAQNQKRNGGVADHFRRGAADQQMTDAGMTVGAHHQQVDVVALLVVA